MNEYKKLILLIFKIGGSNYGNDMLFLDFVQFQKIKIWAW